MTIQSPIAVEVQLTFWEFYKANVAFTVRQLRKLIWIWAIMAALLAFVLIVSWLHPKPGTDYYQMLQNSKPLLAVFLIPVFLVFVSPWLGTRKFFADRRNVQPAMYLFDANGIRIESSVGTSDLNWSAFVSSRETNDSFLLYVTKAQARIIPKRCFADDAEMQRFRDLIRQHIRRAAPAQV